jgi:hypothetical protein
VRGALSASREYLNKRSNPYTVSYILACLYNLVYKPTPSTKHAWDLGGGAPAPKYRRPNLKLGVPREKFCDFPKACTLVLAPKQIISRGLYYPSEKRFAGVRIEPRTETSELGLRGAKRRVSQ